MFSDRKEFADKHRCFWTNTKLKCSNIDSKLSEGKNLSSTFCPSQNKRATRKEWMKEGGIEYLICTVYIAQPDLIFDN